MRAIVQRVSQASVVVEDKLVSKIDKGLLVLLAIGNEDEDKDLEYLVSKILGLRIFEDENEKMNLSLEDIKGDLLVVSQFTLYGDVRKGRRPNFTDSAPAEKGKLFYEKFLEKCRQGGFNPQKGIFGADMKVNLINDGPVTIMLDSKKTF